MSITPAIRWWCHVENDSVPFAVRWRELAELAAVVGAALLIHAFLQPGDRGPAGAWLHVAVQLAVPLGAAWTLRRSVGARALTRPSSAAARSFSVATWRRGITST